jgi:hypothetical protein
MDDTSLIEASIDSFSLIAKKGQNLFSSLEGDLIESIRRRGNFGNDLGLPNYISDMKKDFEQQLDFCRIKFLKGRQPQSEIGSPKKPRQFVSGPANPGGNPLAAYWDGMWAEIATLMWNGDLKPKSQAEIKQAMFAWFNKNEITIGDTAVTERARALWLRMQALD